MDLRTLHQAAPAHLPALPLLVMIVALSPLHALAGPPTPPKHVTTNANLAFGKFAPGSGGTIRVDINGARQRSGGVILLSSVASPARYTIGASNPANENRAYILTLPANGTVALVSGSNRMPVVNFVSSGPNDGTLPSGPQSFSVGATLQVAPNQPRGNYSGAFQITVDYQ